MDSDGLSLFGSLVFFFGSYVSIHVAKSHTANRSKFIVLALFGIVVSVLGIYLADNVAKAFIILFIIGWWILSNAMAKRFSDIGYDKWKSGWAIIPFALPIVLLICIQKPSGNTQEISSS